MSNKGLGIDLWEVWKMFETKKNFQVQKSKIDEISLPFSLGGPKMAHLELILGGKCQKMLKSAKNS